MLTWMLYVMAVSLLLGLAALAAEHSARLRRAGTRGYWMAAIIASLLLPSIIASVSIELPTIASPRMREKVVALREATSIPLSPPHWISGSAVSTADMRSLDFVLKTAWISVSAIMLLALAINGVQLHRRRRTWTTARLQGVDVHVSADIGPAVVGFLHPGIVIPAWLTAFASREQNIVLSHEQSHIRARDPQIFTIALCLLLFMPWNLPLWWQLRRLRHAIEVDCDARVLQGGQDALLYSRTLIAVGEKQSVHFGAVAAMTESPSLLEQRINIMIRKPTRWWKTSAAALGVMSVALVAIAAQVSPPNASSAPSIAQFEREIPLDAVLLDRYVGHYLLDGMALIDVTRSGTQAQAQVTGMQMWNLHAETPSHFRASDGESQLDFVADNHRPATSLVLHGHGRHLTFTRVDAATAQVHKANLAARIRSNTPAPGSEAAVRKAIEWSASGNPDYSAMAPELAESFRKHVSAAQPVFRSLGSVQTVQFTGVAEQGYDSYRVRFQNGSMNFRVQLDSLGTITGVLANPVQ